MNISKKQTGFTLVELLVVVFAVGLLATISYVGVSAVIKQSQENEMQTHLTSARQKIEDYKKREGIYPTFAQALALDVVPENYEDNIFYANSYAWAGAGTVYCLGIVDNVGLPGAQQQIYYHVSSVNTDPLPGGCGGFEQEAFGNGLNGQVVEASSTYGNLKVESKTPLKGTFTLVATPRPPGYVSTAMIRVAVYLDGSYTSSMTTTQYGSYNGTGTATWYIGSVNYGTSTAVVKVEWQDPVNGWSELISATLPPPETP